MNNTINGLSAMTSMTPGAATTIITLFVFVFIVVTVFLLVKFFRLFVYGLGVLVPTALIAKVSHSIGTSYVQGNTEPFKWTIGILFSILASICIGYLIQHTKFIKNIEKKLK